MAKKKRRLVVRILRWLVLLLLLGILALLAWAIWIPKLRQSITTTYDTYTAARGSISNALSFSGSVSVVSSGYMTAEGDGTVRAVYVQDGDRVEKGDRLARLSSGETVKAEFAGTVNDVLVEAGDEVRSGSQLVQLVDFTNMKVTMRVDEYDISDVYVGQSCQVTFTALEKTFDSTITHINRLSQSAGSVAYYTVTASVEVTDDVLPGMQVSVRIPREEATDVVLLKMDALSFERDNSAYVYTKDNAGELQKTPVEVGVDNGNYVEIKSGLNEGDTVYVEAEADEDASGGLSGLLSGLMGGNQQQFNPQSGGMPDISSFGGGGGFGGGGFGGSNGNSGGRGNRSETGGRQP